MKKIIILIIMFLIIISGKPQKEFSLLSHFNGEYVCYTNKPVASNSVNLGTCYLNYEKPKTEVEGESITIKNFEPASAIKQLKAKVVKTESLASGAVVIYAYSAKIPRSVKINNKKVNLQIAHYEEYSVIGWPLILGSF